MSDMGVLPILKRKTPVLDAIRGGRESNLRRPLLGEGMNCRLCEKEIQTWKEDYVVTTSGAVYHINCYKKVKAWT